MKPHSQTSRQARSHRGEDTQLGFSLKHPVTDCQYQPASGELRAAKGCLNFPAPPVAPSLRELSSEFLGGEMKRDYLAEALCFLILVSVSAWPIVSMVRALSELK